MKTKSKQKFFCYTILYAHVPYYMKIKSKHKFKIRNIKLSKISLPTVVSHSNIDQNSVTLANFTSLYCGPPFPVTLNLPLTCIRL